MATEIQNIAKCLQQHLNNNFTKFQLHVYSWAM